MPDNNEWDYTSGYGNVENDDIIKDARGVKQGSQIPSQPGQAPELQVPKASNQPTRDIGTPSAYQSGQSFGKAAGDVLGNIGTTARNLGTGAVEGVLSAVRPIPQFIAGAVGAEPPETASQFVTKMLAPQQSNVPESREFTRIDPNTGVVSAVSPDRRAQIDKELKASNTPPITLQSAAPIAQPTAQPYAQPRENPADTLERAYVQDLQGRLDSQLATPEDQMRARIESANYLSRRSKPVQMRPNTEAETKEFDKTYDIALARQKALGEKDPNLLTPDEKAELNDIGLVQRKVLDTRRGRPVETFIQGGRDKSSGIPLDQGKQQASLFGKEQRQDQRQPQERQPRQSGQDNTRERQKRELIAKLIAAKPRDRAKIKARIASIMGGLDANEDLDISRAVLSADNQRIAGLG